MKCFTVNVSPDGTTIQKGIKRRVRNSPAGPITWLGYPWTARTDKGCANLGRHCDVIHLDNALLQQRPADEPNAEVDVTIDECDVGNLKPMRLTEPGRASDEVLVLIRVSTHEQRAEYVASEHTIAEGYVIEKGQVLSRHPNTFVKQSVEERLVILGDMQSVKVRLYDDPARVYGLKIHSGQRTSLSIMYDRETAVTCDQTARRPLHSSTFSGVALFTDLIGLLLVVGFCIMCGVLVTSRELLTNGVLFGGLVGFGVFQLIAIARVLYAVNYAPSYTSPKPVPFAEEP